jgi:hypothetical protein
MKTQISESHYYTLHANYPKNRVYLIILKEWDKKWDESDEFSNFSSEWEEIISKITREFTIICDFRLMPILSRQTVDLFEQMQEYVRRNGLCYIAEITAENDISNLQMARIAERSQVPMKRFQSYELADKFLDRFLEECI